MKFIWIYIIYFILQQCSLAEKSSVLKVYDDIKSLELKIDQTMVQPQFEDGDVLIDELHQYFVKLWIIRDGVYDKNKTFLDVSKMLFDTKTKDKPRFFKNRLNGSEVYNCFHWTQPKVQLFNFLVEDCQDLWKHSKEIYEETINPLKRTIKTPSEESDYLDSSFLK